MDDVVDLLRIKIEKAKAALPAETVNAINTVDWKAAILQLREKKGYTFEQLGDLELETELLLAGLITPESYPKELENRMGISKAEANELVNEMNNLVFKKIREELIKNTERKKIFAKKRTEETQEKEDTQILSSHGIEILPVSPTSSANKEKLELEIRPEEIAVVKEAEKTHPILTQKISGPLKIPIVKTEHSLDNLSKTTPPPGVSAKPKIPGIDPYREIPE